MGYFNHSFIRTFFSILRSIFAIPLAVNACIVARHLNSFFIDILAGLYSTCYISNCPFAAISLIHIFSFFN